MEISINDFKKNIVRLNDEINRYLREFGDSGEKVSHDPDDLDEVFLFEQLYHIMEDLYEVQYKLEYILKPVIEQGYIKHNSLGRYELPSGHYFTSGSRCEILYTNKDTGEQYWVITTIEHNGEDYYARALGKDKDINGMLVRIRGDR